MASADREAHSTTVGKWLLALVVPASGLALGSVPAEVLVVMSAIAAAACGALWSVPGGRVSVATRWVLAAMAVLLGMTVLQALPLPAAITHSLTPSNADIWERALSPLREPGPAWHTLSVAPSATRTEVLRGFFYGCVFLAAIRVAGLEHGERFLTRLVVFSSAVMAIGALAHMAVGAEHVFGVYRPREVLAYRPGRLAPLLNTSHLAAYLNVGACVSLGALLSRRSMPRALSGSIMLVLAATSVWQGSRGAVAALAVGVVLTIALTLYTKRRLDGVGVRAVVLSACGIAVVVTVSVALSDIARVHLLSRDLTKVDVARESLRLVASSPWFGVGRGGFETVFSSVHESVTYNTFTHPEDLLVQWLVEWGVPVSVAGLAILAWALRPQVIVRAVRPQVGAWAAIVAAVLHELVDYHFEAPGVVALVAVCVAVVVSGRQRSSREPGRASAPSFPRNMAYAMVVGSVVAAAVAWPGIGHSLAEDRRTLSDMAVDPTVPPAQFRKVVRAAILRHPAEPFIPLMGAVRAQVNDEGSVVAWVARALERNPRFGRAHYVLARSLTVGHAAQARLEYRLAYESDERLRTPIVQEGSRLVFDVDSALDLVPRGAEGVDMLSSLVGAVAHRLPATAVILDREIERRVPGAPGPVRRRAEAAVSDATNGAPWCGEGNLCRDDAIVAAEALAKSEPSTCASHMLVARLRVASGDAAGALDGLERAMILVADRAECQRRLITVAYESGQPRRGDLALEQLVRGGCSSQADCVSLYDWAAKFEEQRGHFARAVLLYRRILELQPNREDLLEHIGALGARDGTRAYAIEAFGTLAARHPTDPRWPARIAELRSRAGPSRALDPDAGP